MVIGRVLAVLPVKMVRRSKWCAGQHKTALKGRKGPESPESPESSESSESNDSNKRLTV